MLALGGGGGVAVGRPVHLTSVAEYQTDQKNYVGKKKSKRVLISVRGTLSCTYVWRWRTVETNQLVVFDVPYPLLIVTYTTGMPQLRIRLNMLRALLRPSSGARDYNGDYHIDRLVL